MLRIGTRLVTNKRWLVSGVMDKRKNVCAGWRFSWQGLTLRRFRLPIPNDRDHRGEDLSATVRLC